MAMLTIAALPVFGQIVHGVETALIGEVAKLSSGTISLTDKSGRAFDVAIDSRTTVIGRRGTTTVSQIKTGDLVAAIATTSSQASTSAQPLARKVFVREVSPTAGEKKQIITGIVTGVNASEITLLQKNKGETFYTMSASASAVVKGKGNQLADAVSIILGQRVAVVGTVEEENTITPLLIHILSEKP